jgi:hypothetical protein
MARPDTLSQAVSLIRSGVSRDIAWAGLLDRFYGEADDDKRRGMLRPEPPPSGDARVDCLAAATANYLWKQYRLGGSLPSWVMASDRVLPEPWFTTSNDSAAIREYLTFASPAEFIQHNIFTDEAPFRRASQQRHDAAHPSLPSAGNVSSSQ